MSPFSCSASAGWSGIRPAPSPPLDTSWPWRTGCGGVLPRPGPPARPDRGAAAGGRSTARDWTAASSYALLNWLLDLACLGACAYAVGLTGVGPDRAARRVRGRHGDVGLSLLPGGLGAVDAARVLGLVAAGSPATVALSAVVLYRMISLVGVVAAGWVVHAVQRRR